MLLVTGGITLGTTGTVKGKLSINAISVIYYIKNHELPVLCSLIRSISMCAPGFVPVLDAQPRRKPTPLLKANQP